MTEGGRPYGLIENGDIVVEGGRIAWCGTSDALPSQYAGLNTVDLEGRLVTPALIDCHTHLIYGGNRAREFELRLNGASYEEIARQGRRYCVDCQSDPQRDRRRALSERS